MKAASPVGETAVVSRGVELSRRTMKPVGVPVVVLATWVATGIEVPVVAVVMAVVRVVRDAAGLMVRLAGVVVRA